MVAKQSQTWNMSVEEDGAIRLSGEIDYTVTPEVRSRVFDQIKKTEGEIVFRLDALEYLDSSGLAVFIEVRRKLLDVDRSLRIDGITPQVHKIFQLTQVGTLFGL